MLKIGLTGGIGSGKSTVAQAFAAIGVPVYNCDRESRRIVDTDPRIVSALTARYGSSLYAAGVLGRKALASIIFSSKAELEFVDSLVHPIVAEDFLSWADGWAKRDAKWVMCETAILVESGLDKIMDRLVVVSAPRDVRVARAMARDGATREQIERRIDSQIADEKLIAMADFVIRPDDRHFIFPQIMDISAQLASQVG